MQGLQMKYFVLKPRGNSVYAEASRHAMREYAEAIRGSDPKLSQELRDWVFKEVAKLQEERANG